VKNHHRVDADGTIDTPQAESVCPKLLRDLHCSGTPRNLILVPYPDLLASGRIRGTEQSLEILKDVLGILDGLGHLLVNPSSDAADIILRHHLMIGADASYDSLNSILDCFIESTMPGLGTMIRDTTFYHQHGHSTKKGRKVMPHALSERWSDGYRLESSMPLANGSGNRD